MQAALALALLLPLLLATTRNAGAAASQQLRAEDFAPSNAARGSEWYHAFRSTFDDRLAQRYANPGTRARTGRACCIIVPCCCVVHVF
jgi:hypothetical protein